MSCVVYLPYFVHLFIFQITFYSKYKHPLGNILAAFIRVTAVALGTTA